MSEAFFTQEDSKLVQQDSLFPKGVWPVTITGAKLERKDDKKYVQLEMTVVDGEMTGRKKWAKFYVRGGHPSEKLVKFHASILKSLDTALGLGADLTAESVIGQSCQMEVSHSESKNNGQTYDNVVRFLPA
jgi:hypothetical protein